MAEGARASIGPFPLHRGDEHPSGSLGSEGVGGEGEPCCGVGMGTQIQSGGGPEALWLPGLPQTLIVNDTALGLAKAEGMAPLFWLLNLLRGGIVYAEFYTGRSQWDVERLLRKIHRLYGGWLRRLVTDWGFWYRRVSVVWAESMCGCSLLSLKGGWRALRDTSQGGSGSGLSIIPPIAAWVNSAHGRWRRS